MMTSEEREILHKIQHEAGKVKSSNEFHRFFGYIQHHFEYVEIVIPSIIENLSNIIDIKNNVSDWEEIIQTSIYYTDSAFNTFDKLYRYYPNYPIECLFELFVSSAIDCVVYSTWYNPINEIYTKYYIDKIDKELFDKYIICAYEDNYFTAFIYQNNLDIPQTSIYFNITSLLEERCELSLKIKERSTDKFDKSYITINDFTSYNKEDKNIVFYKGGSVAKLETFPLKSAILETDEFKIKNQKSFIEQAEETINFHTFLIYQWGIVKYFKYIYKYGDYSKYSKLYNKFFVSLEKEAIDTNNIVAIENLSRINDIVYFKIVEVYPDEINEKVLIEGAKKQITVNAYERNSRAREECIRKYGYDCFICGFNFKKVYGEMGKDFIHVHHLKPLSEIQKEYKINPLEDLRPVCPNCHAMLHRKVPAYSIDEIKDVLKGKIE